MVLCAKDAALLVSLRRFAAEHCANAPCGDTGETPVLNVEINELKLARAS
jgi:hypothetical protein